MSHRKDEKIFAVGGYQKGTILLLWLGLTKNLNMDAHDQLILAQIYSDCFSAFIYACKIKLNSRSLQPPY